jgi:malonyl-CoA O-methyltransferase
MIGKRQSEIAAAFAKADRYDDHAVAQRHAATELARRIAALPLRPSPRVLEIGCGTGLLASLAAPGVSGAEWLMTDLSSEMVDRCRARFRDTPGMRFAVLDGERATRGASERGYDLLCSNFAVQWFQDPEASLARLFDLVAPGGHLLVATLGAGTFHEWRAAHDACGVAPGTLRFVEAERLASTLFDGVPGAVQSNIYVERHGSAAAFLRSLKAIGAETPAAGHAPLRAGAMRAVMRAFEAAGSHVSYEILYLHVTKPGTSQ